MEALLGLGSIADGSSNSSRHRRQCLLRGSRTAAQKAKAMGLGATPIQEAASGELQNGSSFDIASFILALSGEGGGGEACARAACGREGSSGSASSHRGRHRGSRAGRGVATRKGLGVPIYPEQWLVNGGGEGSEEGGGLLAGRGVRLSEYSCRDPPSVVRNHSFRSGTSQKFLYYLPAHRQNCTFGQSLRLAE
mmetsp:Transcript_83753/g.162862  ORF Transcript_83753/g.162862 Transcript_83753/m.162862 type:complete len:194 (+) Transcript_83753:1753-2334(+)